MDIRPISDLRNKFTEIENIVKEGTTVYLTKNGYGSMVVMSLDKYETLTENIETKLDETDEQAHNSSRRYNHKKVFSRIRGHVNDKKKV